MRAATHFLGRRRALARMSGFMHRVSGASWCSEVYVPRRKTSFRTLLALACGLASLCLTNGVHASDPRSFGNEIITPTGWDQQTARRVCLREGGESVEIVVPEGWDDVGKGDKLTWSGCMSSDLVIPTEWTRMRAESMRARRR